MANNIYGKFFFKLIGKNIEEITDIETINKMVEAKKDTILYIKPYKSSTVPNRGSVFKYSKKKDDLNQEIDTYLS